MEFTKFRYFILICLFLILSFLTTRPTEAANFFVDDFSSSDLSQNWDFLHIKGETENSWKVENNVLVGEVGQESSSHLYIKPERLGLIDNYTIKFDAINESGVDQSVLFRISPDRQLYYQVDFRYDDPFWPQDNNNVKLYKYDHGNYFLLGLVSPSNFGNSFILSQNQTHHIKIVLEDENIQVYFDSELVFDHDSSLSGYNWDGKGLGFRTWGGSYFVRPVRNIFDNVVLSSEDSGVVHKIVILPGLGASWNGKAMVYNETVEAKDWKMTPFVKTYDGLISALEAKGLQKGNDFYVWNYDWRKPVGNIVENFDDFVDSISESGEKVDLVGHSLGGLVARLWSQGNLDKVNKVVSLGSPHYGAINAYDAWSGGKVSDKFDIRSIALNVLLQLQKKENKTRLETIRAYVPVLKDLLPTFDFAKMGRRVLSVSSLESRNDYLMSKNLAVVPLYENLMAMVGLGEKTKEWVELQSRSIFDEALGLWPDGKPKRYLFGEGDGTVLEKSAKFEDDVFVVESNTTHGQMVNDLTEEVFDELGLGEVTTILNPVDDLSSYTVFFVGSSVEMHLDCDGDIYEEEEGFVLIDGSKYNDCSLSLSAVNEGIYHLVMGRADSPNWHYFEGGVNLGEEIVLGVDPDGGGLILDDRAEDYLYNLIKRDLQILAEEYHGEINLMGALTAVEQRNLDKLFESIFNFRGGKEEMEVSGRILANLELLLARANAGTNEALAKAKYLEAVRAKSMVDRRIRLLGRRGWRPGVFGAMSYQMIEEKVEEMKIGLENGDYAPVWAKAELIRGLLKEVL